MRYELGLLGVSCALLASGCSTEDVNSDAIRTRGIFADMLALASGDGATQVRVQLTVGGQGGTNVTLVQDDVLQVRAGDGPLDLVRSGKGRYERRVDGDAASTISIELERGSADVPAGGTAVLPEPFDVSWETDVSAGLDRSRSLRVSWEPAEDATSLAWKLDGRCIWSKSGVVPDAGDLSIGPESFEVLGTHTGEDCEVTLSLDRQNDGVLDQIWIPGSRFRAIQRRVLSFVSTPAAAETESTSDDP